MTALATAPQGYSGTQIALHRVVAVLAAMGVTGALAGFGDVTQAPQAHNALRVVLLALVARHVLAIPFHRIVLKNDVMRRMIRPGD